MQPGFRIPTRKSRFDFQILEQRVLQGLGSPVLGNRGLLQENKCWGFTLLTDLLSESLPRRNEGKSLHSRAPPALEKKPNIKGMMELGHINPTLSMTSRWFQTHTIPSQTCRAVLPGALSSARTSRSCPTTFPSSSAVSPPLQARLGWQSRAAPLPRQDKAAQTPPWCCWLSGTAFPQVRSCLWHSHISRA